MKPPPHDHEAERGALSCIIQSPSPRPLLLRLVEEDFDDLRNRELFVVIRAMLGDINQVTIYQRLKDLNKPWDYFFSIVDASPSPANFPYYLDTIKDRTWRRRQLERVHGCLKALHDPAIPVREIETMIGRL